jgi:hypothetical protein
MSGNPYRGIADKFRAPYEPGITRGGVLARDGWTCKMGVCVYGDRTIDRTIRRIDNGQIPDDYGTVDHIVPISAPGTPGHVWENVRAAHCLCNRIDLARYVGFWSTGNRSLLTGRVPEHIVEQVESIKGVLRRALQGLDDA